MSSPFEKLSLHPIHYFDVTWDLMQLKPKTALKSARYLVPSLEEVTGEAPFAELYMAWEREGLHLLVDVQKKIDSCFFPNYEAGDSFELFIDTRALKSAGFPHKFCHHFLFLPEAVEGIDRREIIRFRTEDAHAPCDPDELQLKVSRGRDSYSMEIFIPSSCLNGYEGEKIGFTYRLNRPEYTSQHFNLLSEEFTIGQNPALWSTAELKK